MVIQMREVRDMVEEYGKGGGDCGENKKIQNSRNEERERKNAQRSKLPQEALCPARWTLIETFVQR